MLIVFVLHRYRNGGARSLVESFTHEAKNLGNDVIDKVKEQIKMNFAMLLYI